MNASSPVTNELPDILREITNERVRQIKKGWTPEHDDDHLIHSFIGIHERYLDQVRYHTRDPYEIRNNMIKAVTVLVAGIEFIDRNS